MNREAALKSIIDSVKAISPPGFTAPTSGPWADARDRLKAAFTEPSDAEFLQACNAYTAAAKAHLKPEPEKISPCPKCGFPIFWLSIYRDGVLRCGECEPPPSPRLVARKIFVTPDGAAEPEPEEPLVIIGRESTDPMRLLMHLPWPDWSKRPGQWRRDRPSEITDDLDPVGELVDGDAQPAISVDQVRRATSQPTRRATPEPPPHKDPNPGCLRDYRGKGGDCTHPLACHQAQFIESYTKIVGKGDKRTEKRFNQMRVTCNCGKFVGYRSDPVG